MIWPSRALRGPASRGALTGQSWTDMTHRLSGLFCSSLDLLAAPDVVAERAHPLAEWDVAGGMESRLVISTGKVVFLSTLQEYMHGA